MQIVYQGEMCVVKTLCLFHDADAPIKVCRIPELRVIFRSQCTSWKESLMAHHHALAETLPGKIFWSGKTTHTQEISLLIYKSCLSVEDIRPFLLRKGSYHLPQGFRGMKCISGV